MENAVVQQAGSVAVLQSSTARRLASQKHGQTTGSIVQPSRYYQLLAVCLVLRQFDKVKELPGRGRGLVATRTIARGRTVLFEEPLIMVRNRQGANAEVRRQYQGLAKEQRQCYDSFAPEMANKQDHNRVEKIFWKHCVQVGGDLRAMFSRC